MKKVFIIMIAALLSVAVLAQVPSKMSYQAVIRNSSNQLVINQVVGMRISILQGSTGGIEVYAETQTPQTNANGLVTIEIGGGAGFNTINWAMGNYFIKTETDPTGGTNYSITGTSQLLSVPYAMHATSAESITGTINETDPVFTGSQAVHITTNDIAKLSNLSGLNTGDQDLSGLATTASVTASLNSKVDKEAGKGLSTNDYTTSEKTKVSNLSGINTGDQDLSGLATTASVTAALNSKVDKEAGKGLSTNDYTTSEKAKVSNLSGINTGDQDLSGLATTASVTASLISKVDKEAGKGLSTNDYTTQEKLKVADLSGMNTGDETAASIKTKLGITTLSGINTGDQNGSETKVTAGSNVTVSGSGTSANPYVINATSGSVLTIGASYQGGIIFWLDESHQHGLIAATVDQSTGVAWDNGTPMETIAVRDGIYAGISNTERIISYQKTGNYAAQLCSSYKGGGYGDWYLPSKHELSLLYLQRSAVKGFTSTYYWCSTESKYNEAWQQNFGSGTQSVSNKSYPYYVRAIRAF